jgi:hypothetical protein
VQSAKPPLTRGERKCDCALDQAAFQNPLHWRKAGITAEQFGDGTRLFDGKGERISPLPRFFSSTASDQNW